MKNKSSFYQPLVSIPLLTYNGEKYLEEQLESILNQTYKNIEVIVFDDCSTDDTKKILQKYKESHNLKYVINEKNIGLRENALKSFHQCSGEYIAPSDQDDIWKLDKIEKLVNNIGKHSLIYTDSIPIDSNGHKLDEFYFGHFSKLIEGSNNKSFFFGNCISAHAMMFHKSLLTYIFTIPKEMYFHDWWIAFIAATRGSIKLLDEPLVYYRRHQTQITKDKDKNYNIFTRIKFREKRILQKKQDIIQLLNAFKGFKYINDKDRNLLDKLIYNIEMFQNTYKNDRLKKLLHEHKTDLFEMSLQKNIDKIINKFSKGIWYYRMKFYT